ncbi:unnamed protein product [Phyllotreta striolata]|uniref:Putative inorganic phosphate cotransporter n=1 Tax=Phyllotreta striolata TaxID=444603 RepID=A0A9N9TNM4_PHYSR|nr:unnamed protein product [Phyllotreta striolata]
MDINNKAFTGPRFGQRHVQICLLFTMITIIHSTRTQLPVALIAMTSKDTSSNPDVPVYDWKNTSIILSSFYWGYIWLQIPAGKLIRLYGTKPFLLASMITNATICAFCPLVVKIWGSGGLMAIRILQGLSQGFLYPCIVDMLSKWCPVAERTTLATLAYCGADFGAIATSPIVALISTTWYGWPLSFYLLGVAGYAWAVVFYILGSGSPASHRYISDLELEYIQCNLKTNNYRMDIPWKKILRNVPFWAVFITLTGQYFSNLLFMLETPTYIAKVMKFDITSNGILSAAPNVASFLSSIFFSYLAEYLMKANFLSLIWTRKIFTAIGCLVPAATVLILAFLPANASAASVAMLIVSSASQSACSAGVNINHIDLSPNFAALLFGIINTPAVCISIFGPIAVQFIVTAKDDKAQWQIIFFIASAVYAVPCLIYMYFASAKVQPFNDANEKSIENNITNRHSKQNNEKNKV